MHKTIDKMGRSKILSYAAVDESVVRESLSELEFDISNGRATRWALRAIVNDDVNIAEIRGMINSQRSVEENSWEISKGARFIWLAANNDARSPSLVNRKNFISEVERLRLNSTASGDSFQNRADRLIEAAKEGQLHIECYDPTGRLGNKISNPKAISEMLSGVFYIEPAVSSNMARGEGYSELGHYVFALKDARDRTLCMYILAVWPWGIEGTYTIVNPLYRSAARRAPKGAASFLMLAANTLVHPTLNRGEKLYGEANLYNCPACVSAGFEISRPEASEDGLWYRNVVWSDNPINLDPQRAQGESPSFQDSDYYNYVLVELNTRAVEPLKDAFWDFL